MAKPPWHINVKGDWTAELQEDWNDFEVAKQERAIRRFIEVFQSRVISGLAAAAFAKDALLGLDLSQPMQFMFSSSSVLFIFIIIARTYGATALQKLRKHPLNIGIGIQLFVLVYIHVTSAAAALSIEDELIRHRYYLTANTVCTMTMFGNSSLPLWVYLWVAGPAYLIIWLAFHWMVGFWSAPMIFTGTLFFAFFPVALASWIDSVQWEQFHAHRQLDRERQVLEETQSALHCMLSCQWDASCTCDGSGRVASSTPHLDQLISDSSSIEGLNLCSFAANSADAERLQEFLSCTLSEARHQALSLNCTLKPRYLTPCKDAATIEVALYGIRLPRGAVLKKEKTAGTDDGHVFIGIRAANAPLVETLEGSDPTSSFEYSAFHHQHSAIDELEILDELVSESAFTEDKLHDMLPSAQSCSSKSSLAFTSSSATGLGIPCAASLHRTGSTTSTHRTRSTHVGIQTEATGPMATKEVETQTSSLPPRASGAPSSAPSAAPRPPDRDCRFLAKPKKMLQVFRKTKRITVHHLLEEVRLRCNFKGAGCCAWHVSGLAISKELKAQTSSPCKAEFLPFSAWQCAECLAMNSPSDDEECGACCSPSEFNAEMSSMSSQHGQDTDDQSV